MSDLVVWGAGGHGRVAADLFLQQGVRPAGFVADGDAEVGRKVFAGLSLLGGREWLEARDPGSLRVHLAVGDNGGRSALLEWVLERGLALESCVAASAAVSPRAALEAGCFVGPLAAVNAGARLGACAIVNTGASVDHDCEIGACAHLSPGVRLGGGVVVGRESWLGLGAVVRDHRRVGSHCVLGAGSLLLEDLPDGVLAYGSPARIVRSI